ncbi:hypothetical protein H4582DRAFT_1018927 [Lactarius indigo]|nr:hypothetical protein H4582DRAFT_1018927 [Lactarius indigo]
MPQAHSSCQSLLFQDSPITTVAHSFNTLALFSLVLFSVVLPTMYCADTTMSLNPRFTNCLYVFWMSSVAITYDACDTYTLPAFLH